MPYWFTFFLPFFPLYKNAFWLSLKNLQMRWNPLLAALLCSAFSAAYSTDTTTSSSGGQRFREAWGVLEEERDVGKNGDGSEFRRNSFVTRVRKLWRHCFPSTAGSASIWIRQQVKKQKLSRFIDSFLRLKISKKIFIKLHSKTKNHSVCHSQRGSKTHLTQMAFTNIKSHRIAVDGILIRKRLERQTNNGLNLACKTFQ